MACDARLRGGRRAGVPRWHARGQGFKSPQLHQAQRIFHPRSERHLPEICQSLTDRVGKNTRSADRFRYFGTHGASVIVRTFSTGLSSTPRSPCRRAAGWWSWAGSSSGAGPPRTAAPDRPSRSWPRSWGQASAGRDRAGRPATTGHPAAAARPGCRPRATCTAPPGVRRSAGGPGVGRPAGRQAAGPSGPAARGGSATAGS